MKSRASAPNALNSLAKNEGDGDALQKACLASALRARRYVLGPICLSCNVDFITWPRAIAHLTRGALACTLPWRFGQLPEFPADQVVEADLFDKRPRREAKASGSHPGVGISCRCCRLLSCESSFSDQFGSNWYLVRY